MYELAVIDSYTEQQFGNLDTSNLDQVAELLGKEYLALQADEASVEGRKAKLDFLAADAFIVMRRLLGIKPEGGRPSKNMRHVAHLSNQKLNDWCLKAGRKRRTLERDAVTAKKWPKGDRVPGLTFGHYKAVEGMDHADARKLLLDAQMGEPKHVYRSTEWVKTWSVERLRKERKAFEGDPKEKVESDARGDTVKSKHEMLAKIAKILGADTPKNRRMIKIIEKEVEAV
jgi:hypothetical protein